MIKKDYKISGMACAACSASVERVVSRLEGITSCTVNLMTERMTAEYDETLVTDELIFAAVHKAGFGITVDTPPKKQESKRSKNPPCPGIRLDESFTP